MYIKLNKISFFFMGFGEVFMYLTLLKVLFIGLSIIGIIFLMRVFDHSFSVELSFYRSIILVFKCVLF